MTQQRNEPVMADPHARLERMYVEEYLRSKGLSLELIRGMPEDEARELMREAELYAAAKLAEAESRSHLLDHLAGVGEPT